jgi:hypothetical protein
LNSEQTLDKLSKESLADGVTTYKLTRNIRVLTEEVVSFNEARQKLIERYGEKKEESIEIPPSNRDAFLKELNELFNQEIDVNILTINPEKLPGHSPLEFLTVEWMLELSEEKEA